MDCNREEMLKSLKSLTPKGERFTPKRCNEKWIKENNILLYDNIIDYTKSEKDVDFKTRLLMYVHEFKEIPLCKECKTEKLKLKSLVNYSEFCSNRCAIKNEDVQLKTQRTCEERYGKRFNVTQTTYQLGEHHNHRNIRNIDDVGNREFLQNLLVDRGWKGVAEHFNLTTKSHSSAYKFLREYCEIEPSEITKPKSNLENEVYEYIKTIYSGLVEKNTKSVISPMELDIYIPDKSFAVEVNGLYWHSFDRSETMDEKIYHLKKTELCEDRRIKLFHIFENEWIYKTDIIKSMLKTMLGVVDKKLYTRKSNVKLVDANETFNFLEQNHIQGGLRSFSHSVGLYHENDLVALIVVGKSRFRKNEIELLRFCSKLNTVVVGAFSKLMKHIKSIYANNDIISYGNRRWCYIHENVYIKNGFDLVSRTSPNYFYFKHRDIERLFNRMYFQKHKLEQRLDVFDETKTETENMFENGYRRIWDCGNLKYVLTQMTMYDTVLP